MGSVAKSQLLRYVLATSNRAVATTGRGTSGVGLTAAVTTDQETNERRLEAGAMVLADRGIVCIDEFDKMSDIDRTAIHEVMEQGRVTISKAGIHARLNARCSVLAAANPVYGRYDPYKTPMENIGLQDSLLSRFDLLFILLDSIDKENDRKIADLVVNAHMYRDPREPDGAPSQINTALADLSTREVEKTGATPLWEKQVIMGSSSSRGKRTTKILSSEFIGKYVEYAKRITPALSDAACELIAEEYADLRSQDYEHTDVARTQPITARCLETLIRLATAAAKARLSKTVERQDAELAIELIQFTIFRKVLDKKGKRKAKDSDEESEEEDNVERMGDPEPAESGEKAAEKPEKKKARKSTTEEGAPAIEAAAAIEINEAKLKEFMAKLNDLYTKGYRDTLPMAEVFETFAKENFSEAEVKAYVKKMTDDNKVMESDNVLYRI